MSVDFFTYAEAVPTQKDFAICDDHDQKPVRIEHIGDSEHQVTVLSENRTDYFFIPVDHNILLKRQDGSDDKICDAILYTKNTICFIEIKCWRTKGWIPAAADQIVCTIGHFYENHPSDAHRYRDAYICNWKKRHSILNESNNELKNKFFEKHRVHLYISNIIKELA